MPALSTSHTTTALNNGKPTTSKHHLKARSKKTRVMRRRGRAKDGLDSDDDEIEREVGTDESDSEHPSLSSASDSDSDTEPASDDVHIQQPRVATASDGSRTIDVDVLVPVAKDSHPVAAPAHPSFFAPNEDWSEMVNEEDISGPAELPVIDFQDFNGSVSTQAHSRKTKAPKGATKSSAATPAPSFSEKQQDVDDAHEADSHPSERERPSNFAKRVPGQTARQAYQQRLESDPSYVPVVGEFWSHDDRLLDKGLRSLSNWWRGRWQGRGRGRGGIDRGFVRGRGRGGGYDAGRSSIPPDNESAVAKETPEAGESDVAPIDKTWTHDGFEELKRREQQASMRGGFRGRFAGARGGRGGSRGFTSPSRGRGGPFMAAALNRPWFTTKPERMWTKQHEAFLYYDHTTKPTSHGQVFRVKLSGGSAKFVRTPHSTTHHKAKFSDAPPASEKSDQPFVVRMPNSSDQTSPAELEPSTTAVALPKDESPEEVEEVFKVRPHLVVPQPIPLPNQAPATTSKAASAAPNPISPVTTSLPQPEVIQKLEQLSINTQDSSDERRVQTEQAVLRQPPRPEGSSAEPTAPVADQRPVLPPLQTAFPPAPPLQQPTPPYGSPYAYPTALPPGVGINNHGVPYEISTGRPVYLQPPVPMYNPRPMMGGPSFVPTHMHHRSTPDFFPHQQSPSHTPPVNGFIDPSTGTPIFSLPRTSRIQIRAPDGSSALELSEKNRRTTSHSRLGSSSDTPLQPQHQPSASVSSATSYPQPQYPHHPQHYFSPSAGGYPLPHPDEQHIDPSVMQGYPSYPHQYYYPPHDGGYGADGYGYPQYMDVNSQYEMYPSNPIPAHPQDHSTTYY